MAHLLSREKEFLKLNQKLDNIATNVLDTARQTKTLQTGGNAATGLRGRSTTPANGKSDQRYYTYTKSKGPSTLLKKTGVGNPGTECQERLAIKPHNDVPSPKRLTKTTMETTRKDPPRWNAPCNSVRNTTTKSGNYSALTKRPANNTVPKEFTVKYMNANFVESPSLREFLNNNVCTEDSPSAPTEKESASTSSDPSDPSTDDTAAALKPTVTVDKVTRSTGGAQIGKKQVSNDGMVKFLKSKLAILEDDHELLTSEMKKQKELLENSLERQKKLEQQRDQAYSKYNNLADELTKTEQLLDDANRRVNDCVRDHTIHNKEAEKAKRELKLLKQSNANLEKRLYNATEEIEGLKNTVQVMKNQERELRESMRSDNESKDKQIKNLKKQRSDLLAAYKKQLYLIENLKRQTVCMEQSKMISFGESEFTKVLDWNSS